MPETGYAAGQDRAQMWRSAKNAAQAVMDLGQYSLFRANPAPGDSAAVNYYELFITPSTDESILERYYRAREGDEFLESDEPHGVHQYHGPNGYHQWGGTTPTQQQFGDEAFPLEKGRFLFFRRNDLEFYQGASPGGARTG